MFTIFKKLISLIIYIFMTKIMFNFKCIHTYTCVTYYFLKNNLTNCLYFYNKKLCFAKLRENSIRI